MTQSDEFRPGWDHYFMLQAHMAKLRSNCSARKVGAVVVQDRRQIATGYNGTPPRVTNCFDGGCDRCKERKEGRVASREGYERCICIHAEANAILQCALMGVPTKGASLYCTFHPCLGCAKMIVAAGLLRVVCIDPYEEAVQKLFRDAKVEFGTFDTRLLERWRDEW